MIENQLHATLWIQIFKQSPLFGVPVLLVRHSNDTNGSNFIQPTQLMISKLNFILFLGLPKKLNLLKTHIFHFLRR